MSDPLGLESIIPGVPDVTPDTFGASEQEIAAGIGRCTDSLAELAKLLPIPEGVKIQYTADLRAAWVRLLQGVGVCADDNDFGAYDP